MILLMFHYKKINRYSFDYHPGDVYFCTADVGWITGHSYVVYGPLANGAPSIVVYIAYRIDICNFNDKGN